MTPMQLKIARENAGLTLRQLADKAGCWQSSVKRFERGSFVHPQTVKKIITTMRSVEDENRN